MGIVLAMACFSLWFPPAHDIVIIARRVIDKGELHRGGYAR